MRAFCGLLLAACATQAVAGACDAPEHHQFDFWIGEWSVTGPAGKQAGENSIKAIAGGCALGEHWRGAKGGEGFSYSAYDRERKVWHQTWVDHDGLVLLLEGHLQDGKMVLEGPTGKLLNRVSWEPRKDGSVRQLWESSEDGKTWKTQFDGTYRKKP